MIKAIGWLIKITLFSAAILVLGHWIRWDGKTVSDQVKTQLSHAERSEFAGTLKNWTSSVTEDARKGAKKAAGRISPPRAENEKKRPEEESPERIQSSERQKLKALIQELNSSTSADRRTH